MPQYKDGQIAVGPNGPIVYNSATGWQPLNQGPQGAIPLGPRNNQQARDNARQDRNDTISQANDAANLEFKRREDERNQQKFIAELAAKGMMPDGRGGIAPIPGWTPPLTPDQSKDRTDRIGRLNSLVGQINRTQDLGNQGVFKTEPWSPAALSDYLPTSINDQFNTAGASLSQQGLGAFRIPGTGTVSDRDAIMFDRANLPDTWNRDAKGQEQLRGLRGRVEEEFKALGLPAPQWVLPEANQQDAAPIMGVGGNGGAGPVTPIPGPVSGGISGMGYRGAPVVPASGVFRGPETRKEYDWAAQAHFEGLLRGGASLEQMNAEARARGYEPFNAAEYDAAKAWLKKYPNEKSNIVPPPFKSVSQTGWERFSQGAPGALAIGATNAGSFGGLDAIAPEKMDMARQAHPWEEGAGEIAGVLANQGAANRLFPMGRIPNPIARNLAYDTSYGTIRGAVSNPDDPLAGALAGGGLAMGGSVLGQGVGGLAGRGLTGVRSSPSVAWLRERGVTPTLGQIMRGRASDSGSRSIVAGFEDAISNTPGVGAMVNTARNRAVTEANQAIYREVGGPGINGVGEEALIGLNAAKSRAYDDALRGVSLPANEPRFMSQFDAADMAGRSVDVARGRGDFGHIMDNQLAPLIQGQSISGRQMQNALRLLQGQRRAYSKAATGAAPDPMAASVADALGNVENAFIGNAARNAPWSILKLKAANQLNRSLSILDDAAERAVNNPGANSGVWTAGQLGSAIRANNAKFGKRGLLGFSRSPLAQGQKAMQAVIPNEVPPTGVNVAPWLAGAGLVGGIGNESSGFDSNIVRGIAGALMLASPYTRTGSRAVATALLDRPQSVRKFGALVRQQKGLFGTALAPFAIEYGQ